MAHFAKVENGVVTSVIVIDQETLNLGHWGDPALWVQTSYNTSGGQHPEGRPLRKNYAGIGYTYDSGRDAFIPPKPLRTTTGQDCLRRMWSSWSLLAVVLEEATKAVVVVLAVYERDFLV